MKDRFGVSWLKDATSLLRKNDEIKTFEETIMVVF